MRSRLIVVAVAAAIVVAGAMAFAATRGGGASGEESARSSFASRSQESGEVTVKATLRRLNGDGAEAEVVLDTHSVELDLDIVAGASLTVDGVTWPTERWDGDGPGGHHREGELTFSAAGPTQGGVILTIAGLSEPVAFRWLVP